MVWIGREAEESFLAAPDLTSYASTPFAILASFHLHQLFSNSIPLH
jgi:hypothetical protein